MVCTRMGTHPQTNIHPGDSVKLWRRDNVTALPLAAEINSHTWFFFLLFLLLIISFLVTWPKGKVSWREAMQCVNMALMCLLWFRGQVLSLFHWVLAEVTAFSALHSWVVKKLILKPKKPSVFHLQYTNEIFIQHVSITSRQTEACVQWYDDVMTAIMKQVCQVGEDSAGTGRTGSFKDTTRYLEWCWLLKLPKEPWVIYNSFLSSSQIPSTHALPPCLPMSGTVVAWR